MKPILYAHPFSSYCQKVLIALYENDTPFAYRVLDDDPLVWREFEALWPLKRMPVLVDNGQTVVESSVIIEHLALHYAGPVQLFPSEPRAALEVRKMDRFFDNYVMTPMQKAVTDYLRKEENRDPFGVSEAKATLDSAYRWLDGAMAGREWAAAGRFTLADCAAAPSLFYADWIHPIDEGLVNARSYRARLLARPSFARAVNEARPFRANFPPGAPHRD